MRKALFVMRSRVPRNYFNFSDGSHTWQTVSLDFTWQCVLNDIRYPITQLMILPGGAIQLTLNDQTAVNFPYKDPRWSEFVLFLYHHDSLPNLNRWSRVRYQIVRRAVLKLYLDPVNFRKHAIEREERVIPVPAPPVTGRPG